MRKLKLSALLTLLTLSTLTFSSCEEDNTDQEAQYQNRTIAMTGAQEVPAVPTAATGTINAEYSKLTKTLYYTVNWTGLTGPVAAMHIHGLADPGSNAGIVQNIITASNGIATPSATRFGTSGGFAASVFVDGVAIKEADLLAGKYYINIHTATYPNGEIRGQIVLNP
jgi:hypothetical protein